MNILRKLFQFNGILNDHVNLVRNSEDIYCLGLMKNLLQQGDLLPFTFMSLRPFAMSFAINELLVNKRRLVVEFGSGASTVILARAIRAYGLDCKLISVESDEEWSEQTGRILEKEGLSSCAELIHAPITLREFNGRPAFWYDELTLNERMRSFGSADMVFIDGPAAYEQDVEMSRYFAIPFMAHRMAENHVVFLDDANREGEKKVMRKWKNDFGKEFMIFGSTLGVHYTGRHLDCCPLKFIDKYKAD